MIRSAETVIDQFGSGVIIFGPAPTNLEWDIYRISVETIIQGGPNNVPPPGPYFVPAAQAEIRLNGRFVCWSPMGSKDTAIGPPDIVIGPSDELTVAWAFAGTGLVQLLTAVATFYYNENPTGTTYSTSH